MGMVHISNSTILEELTKALFSVVGRRTSVKTADTTIGTLIRTLEGRFNFLKSIEISEHNPTDEKFFVHVSNDIDDIPRDLIGKAIESMIRVVYSDLDEKAGLYFITELKECAGKDLTDNIIHCGVDLDQIQIEQHITYRRLKRKKDIEKAAKSGKLNKDKPDNLIGYTWDNVSGWKHEPNSKYCTLYDKQGKVLDRLNLDRIIQNYVEKLSGYIEVDPEKLEKETRIYEKDYNLLKLMLERDMDAETAMHMLGISREDLNEMIRKLSEMELLQYADYDTLELTDIGVSYLTKKEGRKNKK